MALAKCSSSMIVYLCVEMIVLLCFACFTEYSDLMAITASTNSQPINLNFYPYFQDIHIMIFIGFGFLMVFLKSHSWTSVSYNMLIAAFSIQLAILANGFWSNVAKDVSGKIPIDVTSLIVGDFGGAAVLITFGAILGKVNSVQLLFIATVEIFIWSLPFNINSQIFQSSDMGGSVVIHTFGAYFGLAVSWMITDKSKLERYGQFEDGNYNSQLIAMVGTVFLFCYWPSFNCALASGNSQMRVVVNTIMSLTASVSGAFALSAAFHNGKFDMEDVLNATLAGGVIVGASSDMLTSVWQSLSVGLIGGIVSSYGFNKIDIGIHDTCGVHNLHGIPGVLGGLIAVFMSFVLNPASGIQHIFPARGYDSTSRSAGVQALYQLAELGVVFFFAIAGGILTGYLVNVFFESPDQYFHDAPHFTDCEYVQYKSPIKEERKEEEERKEDVVELVEDVQEKLQETGFSLATEFSVLKSQAESLVEPLIAQEEQEHHVDNQGL